MTVIGTATVNLADFVAAMEQKEVQKNVLVSFPGGSVKAQPTLTVRVLYYSFMYILSSIGF